MALKGAQVALTGGTRAPLTAVDTDNIAGQSLAILPCAADLFLGDSGVTTSGGTAGAKLPAGTPLSVQMDPRETLYAISATDTTVHVLHQGA